MLAWKAAPALAMGNTVVLKPAEYTSCTAVLFAEICRDIGLPPGVFNLVLGDHKAGAALAASLGITVTELARSVYRIAIANMAEAIRSVTVRRGLDPRNYALFACGGAGPLMAAPPQANSA